MAMFRIVNSSGNTKNDLKERKKNNNHFKSNVNIQKLFYDTHYNSEAGFKFLRGPGVKENSFLLHFW